MRVIDSFTLVKYFSHEAEWKRARDIMLEDIVTLDLAAKELVNALWRKTLRDEINREVTERIMAIS